MKKVIATLRSAPAASVDVPKTFPVRRVKRGEKPREKPREIERSCFGSLRFFPGIPKTISKDELEFIESGRPDLSKRLDVSEYVESKRVDYRGATEKAIETAAESEGIGHLSLKRKVEVLRERGKIDKPDPKKVSVTVVDPPKRSAKTSSGRKPK
jgi:hypothetical protein